MDLAVVRAVIVGVQLSALLPPAGDLQALLQHSALPDEMYDPLPILHLLVAPIEWTYRPGFEVLQAVYWVVVVTGLTSLFGLLTNVSLLVFAVGNVLLQAFKYSFGDFHHPEGLMMIALAMLALSPSGRVLSVDAWLARLRHGTGEHGPTRHASSFARWPLLVIRWLLALAYLSGAFHKLRVAGFDWMNGHTLQHYVLRDATRWDAPLGLLLGQHLWLMLAASVMTILWEGTFFLVLIFPALAWIYIPLGIGLHTGIWLTMRAGFFTFMALYSAFVPWSAVLRWCRGRLPFRGYLMARST
jgi:uncharacterized integral membrane protein